MGYDINDLDKDGVLKPGVLITVIIAFLSRQFFYGPITLLAKRKGPASSGAEIDMSFLTINSLWEFAACIPALIMIYALMNRKPEAGTVKRTIWSNGVKFLLVSTAAQLILILFSIAQNINRTESWTVIFVLAHVYILFYLLKSKRVQDVFSSFPEPTRKSASPTK